MTQRKSQDDLNELTEQVIGSAIRVHRELGPGLLESAYAECLAIELDDCGLSFIREYSIPLIYKKVTVENAYRIDFVVDDALVVECKTVEQLLPIHSAQVLTYLKLTDKRLGLLINFNVEVLHKGVKRIANSF